MTSSALSSNKSRASLWLVCLCLGLSSCASLRSVSMTSVPRDRSRPVEASEDNVAFLGIHFDNEFVDELPARLQAQCPGGKVRGVYTKYESYWYVLVQQRVVTARGYCTYEPATRAQAAPPRPSRGRPTRPDPTRKRRAPTPRAPADDGVEPANPEPIEGESVQPGRET
jgi:hypothetical protein